MPLFEYRCLDCRRRFTVLVGMVAQATATACPRCGGTRAQKLISRFAVARSEDDLLDDLANPTHLPDEDDPRAVAQYLKRIGKEMGEEVGDDFEEMIEEAVHEERSGAGDEDDPAAS